MECGGEHGEFASPLMSSIWRAAQTGQCGRIRQILDRESQHVNSKDEYGYTALHYAARTGDREIVLLLLDRQADVSSLLPEIECARSNLEKCNLTNEGGDTPLHRAAYMGHHDICLHLLKSKADPNRVNSDSQTPLHRAAYQRELQVRSNGEKARSLINFEGYWTPSGPGSRSVSDRQGWAFI